MSRRRKQKRKEVGTAPAARALPAGDESPSDAVVESAAQVSASAESAASDASLVSDAPVVTGSSAIPVVPAVSGEILVASGGPKNGASMARASIALGEPSIFVDSEAFDAIEMDFFKRAEELYATQFDSWEDLEPKKA